MPDSVTYSGVMCSAISAPGIRCEGVVEQVLQQQLQALDVALERVGDVLLDLACAAGSRAPRPSGATRVIRSASAERRPNARLVQDHAAGDAWRSPPGRRWRPSRSRWRRGCAAKCSISTGSNSICCARIVIAEMPSSATESSSPIFSISAISAAPFSALGLASAALGRGQPHRAAPARPRPGSARARGASWLPARCASTSVARRGPRATAAPSRARAGGRTRRWRARSRRARSRS